RMMPSAEVVMLNMRTRSARARPASASRWCSASASSALVLNTSPMYALAPLVAMASRTAWKLAGCGVTTCGITTAEGAPAGRRVGQYRADSGRVAAAALVDPGRAHVQGRVVHPEHGRDLRGHAGQAGRAGVGHRQDQGGRALG